MKATNHTTGLYRNGWLIEVTTEQGKAICKAYKGVIMAKFFVPNSLFEGFNQFALNRGLTINK